jgi:hypothetical protein
MFGRKVVTPTDGELNPERAPVSMGEMFWRRPALRAGRRLSTGPPPAEGGRRPHKILPTRIQKLFASVLVLFLGLIATHLSDS